MMSRRLAPTARRIPISRRRSDTAMSMRLMITVPPISVAITATPTSTLESVARDARIKARRYELESERIIERARDAYREAEELSQTRAGRMKLFVDKCLDAVADELHLEARGSARVEGEKIYLG